MRLTHLWFLTFLFSNVEFSSCKIWEIPLLDPLRECQNSVDDTSLATSEHSPYSWMCEHTLNYTESNTSMVDILNAVNELHRGKRQDLTLNPCVRKEYRMLTLDERRRYHNAIDALRKDTTIKPNAYAHIAEIYGKGTRYIAHRGPGFLGWNRIYLRVYENALKSKDPNVCLPYWDSTLDSKLPDPVQSSLWSPDFLGTPRGPVVDGPFANWRLPSGGQLMRNVGVSDDLRITNYVSDILSRNSYDDIMNNTNSLYNIEILQGSVHVFVGGVMSQLEIAAFDPVFFMHRAFIDYIFERFRQKLRSRGVNPAIYPRTGATGQHAPNAPTLIGSTTQVDGYSEQYARGITYEPVPTCSAKSKTCGGRFLVCQLSSGTCIPTTRSTSRAKRSVPDTTEMSTSLTYDLTHQNNSHTQELCDMGHWAVLPVKIVIARPSRHEMYKPNTNEITSGYISKCYGDLKTYPVCDNDTSTGQIFIYSYGINYRGYYKEMIIMNQTDTETESLGFLAVRKPSTMEGGVSKVLIRAHDACGRVCQVACRNPVTHEDQICSGAVAVSEEEPLMFGYTIHEALMHATVNTTDVYAVKYTFENFNLKLYCD
ncbi:prephenate dehydrogenase (NADP(+)) [Bulinus truncatus]|nr:prephenate dehydrogenase (NADP(+)) [Bulinus truncatus]